VVPIRVPPLRERIDDLPALIDDLIRRGEAAGRPSIRFSDTALDCMRSYRWPGNVRELANLVERMSILFPNKEIRREDLPPAIGERRRAAAVTPVATAIPTGGLDLKEHLGAIERQLIRTALEQTDGTVAHAARLLKLRRTTLVEKLRKYEMQAG
jgi:sigma-54 specific flagellar transcriptional regulator A